MQLRRHPPVRAWACPSGRWVLFEREVEAAGAMGPGDGPKLAHPYFLAEREAARAHQLLMLGCEAAVVPPRLTFAGGVMADLGDAGGALFRDSQRLPLTAWPPRRLGELERLTVLPLPFVPQWAVRGTLSDGRQLWVDDSCREHGAGAVRLRLSLGAEGPFHPAQRVVWSPDGVLSDLQCELGTLRIHRRGLTTASFRPRLSGTLLPLRQLQVARAIDVGTGVQGG